MLFLAQFKSAPAYYLKAQCLVCALQLSLEEMNGGKG
jgi:hypothetical protein